MKSFYNKFITASLLIGAFIFLCGVDACKTGYTISGTVDGDVQAGVTITLTKAGSATTTTSLDGSYIFTGLDSGNFTVTPSLSGYSFSPASANVNVIDADETGVDFNANEVVYTYSISGTVNGDVSSGVTITLSGDDSDTAISDSVGNYSISDLENGSYTVTPSKSGYTFDPASASVNIFDDDETDVEFDSVMNTCDDVSRFLDNSDGTVTDCRTNLIWLQNANCYGKQNRYNAMSSAAGLNSGECGLSDGSTEGGWRLATKEELQGIGTDPPTTWEIGYPSVTWTMPGLTFVNVQSGYAADPSDSSFYWSSTEEFSADFAWHVEMGVGGAFYSDIDVTCYVWPVRSDN